MKWCRALAGLVVMMTMISSVAQAESIKGRIGITGRIGGHVPAQNQTLDPESSLAGGGGVIFGITDILAIEADVVHIPNIEFYNTSGKLRANDVAVGLQLRNRMDDLTAYVGIGADVLVGDGEKDGADLDLETVFGGHIRGGGDYFITRKVALNLDLRGSFFPEADVKRGGVTIANYDPISFIGMVGVRFFLN